MNKKVKRLFEIQKLAPSLTFQNNGYEYPNVTEKDQPYLDEVNEMLGGIIGGFSKFNNFKRRKNGEVVIRYQYNYNHDYETELSVFIGVGYTPLKDLT